MISKPLISVIIPTYNSKNTLKDSVKSVINQNYQNWELIIVDDGSSDKTDIFVKEYLLDKRIKYFFQENSGTANAINNGLKNSKGTYFMLLGSDDKFFPYSIDILVRNFLYENNNNLKIIFGDFVLWNSKDDTYTLKKMSSISNKPEIFRKQIQSNMISACSALVEKKAAFDTGLFNENFEIAEDFDFWNRMIFKYDIKKINIPIYYYRVHNSQLTGNYSKLIYYTDIACQKFIDFTDNYLFKDKNNISLESYSFNYEDLAKNISQKGPLENTILKLLIKSQKIFFKSYREKVIKNIYLNNNKSFYKYYLFNKNFQNNYSNTNSFNDLVKTLIDFYEKPIIKKIYFNKNYVFDYFDSGSITFSYNDKIILLQNIEADIIPKDYITEYKNYDQIWVSSEYSKEILLNLGIDNNKIKVIPYPTNLNKYITNNNSKNSNNFVFLFTGLFIERKGIELLIESYYEEFYNENNVSLILFDNHATSFERKDYINKLLDLNKNKSPEIILYESNYLDFPKLLKNSNCFIYPYFTESSCINIIKAMEAKLPVITTNAPPIKNICNFNNSFLIDSNEVITNMKLAYFNEKKDIKIFLPDKNSLKKNMRYVYENYSLALKKSELGYKEIIRKYSKQNILEMIQKELQE